MRPADLGRHLVMSHPLTEDGQRLAKAGRRRREDPMELQLMCCCRNPLAHGVVTDRRSQIVVIEGDSNTGTFGAGIQYLADVDLDFVERAWLDEFRRHPGLIDQVAVSLFLRTTVGNVRKFR